MKRIIGGKPSDKVYYKSAKSSYENKAYNQIDGYVNIYDGSTIDAFLNDNVKEIVIGIKGTTLNMKDLIADVKLIGNNLKYSDRYKKDLDQFKQILLQYPPNEYSYYITGHSLGGAIVKQLKKDFQFIKEGMTFNSASQPSDLVNQDKNIKDNYIDKDFLYNLTGRFIKNKRVYPYKAKPTSGVMGWLKQKATPTPINAHKLDQFEFMGKGKNKKLIIQSVIVPKDKYSKKEANKWIKDNDFKNKGIDETTKSKDLVIKSNSKEFDETDNFYRYRQEDPELFKDKSYRTKELSNGVKLIFGKYI
jgi:hypothetical protein